MRCEPTAHCGNLYMKCRALCITFVVELNKMLQMWGCFFLKKRVDGVTCVSEKIRGVWLQVWLDPGAQMRSSEMPLASPLHLLSPEEDD